MKILNIIFDSLSVLDCTVIFLLITIKVLDSLIGLRIFRIAVEDHKTKRTIKIVDNFFHSASLSFSILILIIFYLVVKFFVYPYSKFYGISLISLIIVLNARNLFSYVFKTVRKGYNIYSSFTYNAIMGKIYSLIYGFLLFSILLFSFINNLHFSDIYIMKQNLDSEVSVVTKQNAEIEKNIQTLINDLTQIQKTLEKTKESSENLKESIQIVDKRSRQLEYKKEKIEMAIEELELRTEEDIINETSYKIISGLYSQNTLVGIVIGLLTSIIGGVFINFINRKYSFFNERDIDDK